MTYSDNDFHQDLAALRSLLARIEQQWPAEGGRAAVRNAISLLEALKEFAPTANIARKPR